MFARQHGVSPCPSSTDAHPPTSKNLFAITGCWCGNPEPWRNKSLSKNIQYESNIFSLLQIKFDVQAVSKPLFVLTQKQYSFSSQRGYSQTNTRLWLTALAPKNRLWGTGAKSRSIFSLFDEWHAGESNRDGMSHTCRLTDCHREEASCPGGPLAGWSRFSTVTQGSWWSNRKRVWPLTCAGASLLLGTRGY